MDEATRAAVEAGMERGQLSEEERLVALAYVQGVDVLDIARLLDVHRNTVHMALGAIWDRIGPGTQDERSPIRMLRVLVGVPAVFRSDTYVAVAQ